MMVILVLVGMAAAGVWLWCHRRARVRLRQAAAVRFRDRRWAFDPEFAEVAEAHLERLVAERPCARGAHPDESHTCT
jgi:uncharacterized iron-regulated membrane protein